MRRWGSPFLATAAGELAGLCEGNSSVVLPQGFVCPARHQSGMGYRGQDDNTAGSHSHGGDDAPAGEERSAPQLPRQPYRRRSSDPQTLRERMDFRRDHKYGRHRPLPDVPWRQHKERTYLDDAERLYGRKETWYKEENEELREKLVALLQDYLRDSIASARLEIRDAKKYQRLCDASEAEYRAHLTAGAFSSAEILQDWARSVLSLRATSTSGASSDGGEAAAVNDDAHVTEVASGSGGATTPKAQDTDKETDPALAEWREQRRRRGAEAVLEGSVAVADLGERDSQAAPVSAFPFLRQRAVEREHTLDPSLVDWTAKYFPEDEATTFREPPQLRQRGRDGEGDEAGNAAGGADGSDAFLEGKSTSESTSRRVGAAGSAFGRPPSAFGAPKPHARHRLQRSLRAHEDRHRATFDAEGVFYHVREPSEEDERAPRPRPVRGSEVSAPRSRGAPEVVKVPWNVAATAKQQGYTSDILRAKERLIRLSRGEDPETIP